MASYVDDLVERAAKVITDRGYPVNIDLLRKQIAARIADTDLIDIAIDAYIEDIGAKTRSIEMLLAWDDNTWSTAMIDIPSDTPEEAIDRIAVTTAINRFGRSDTSSVLAFVAVYSIPDEEE